MSYSYIHKAFALEKICIYIILCIYKLIFFISFLHVCCIIILQVWQCGGEIMIVTCSRVGHVFRKLSPYSWPGGVARILNTNTRRTVEVWMDNYKEFFYKVNPGLNFIRFLHIDLLIFYYQFA